MLEGYTTLGYVAGQTETMTLGLLVTGVSYRHPGLLAKIVTTLDVLSGGRAMLGLGAAWYEREHVALGVPFHPIAERLERLEETLQICLQMWSADDGPYHGAHYDLAETMNVPPPVRRPRPPILIGGSGERKLLRLVAKYADMNNLFPTSPQEVQHKLDVLARHCDEVGRDRSEIRDTMLARVGPDTDVDELVATIEPYARLGMTHLQVSLLGEEPARTVEQVVAPIVERLREV
jgi:F420-dependent oxidoreductase-like protein